MVESLKLAIMDIDGTITINGQIADSIRLGISHLHEKGVATSVTTGKTYTQILNRIGKDFTNIVYKDTPVGLENGGRIVNGGENTFYHALSFDEIECVEQVVISHSEYITAVQYQPENPSSNMVVWSPKSEDLRSVIHKDLAITDTVTLPTRDFFKKVIEDKPCMLVIAAKENGVVDAFPAGLNVVTNEGVVNVNSRGISKGTSLIEISELTGVPFPNILVAGNDSNDLPLMNSKAGVKIWIGDIPKDLRQTSITQNYSSPEEFGNYLISL